VRHSSPSEPMRFHYQNLRQAILAALRIYGPMKERAIRNQCRPLITVTGLVRPVYEEELNWLNRALLVRQVGGLWMAVPSKVSIEDIK
jgi:hypothetical protein